MELYIIRHGEAEPPGATDTDAERQLTARGRQDMEAVARALARAGLRPQRVLCSPLVRARRSAEIVAEALGAPVQPDERVLAPGCTLGTVQELAAAHPGEQVVLVGHEPQCSQVVSQLIGGGGLRMRAGACARVDCERVEPGAGVLQWLVTPEVLPLASD